MTHLFVKWTVCCSALALAMASKMVETRMENMLYNDTSAKKRLASIEFFYVGNTEGSEEFCLHWVEHPKYLYHDH